ncbi:hypothetical protein D3C73_1602980 [compost metagenome]
MLKRGQPDQLQHLVHASLPDGRIISRRKLQILAAGHIGISLRGFDEHARFFHRPFVMGSDIETEELYAAPVCFA